MIWDYFLLDMNVGSNLLLLFVIAVLGGLYYLVTWLWKLVKGS